MKIHEYWQRHVEAWRELPINQDLPLEVIPVQAAPSVPVAATEASAIMLRLAHGAQLELSTAVTPHWPAELLRCMA